MACTRFPALPEKELDNSSWEHTLTLNVCRMALLFTAFSVCNGFGWVKIRPALRAQVIRFMQMCSGLEVLASLAQLHAPHCLAGVVIRAVAGPVVDHRNLHNAKTKFLRYTPMHPPKSPKLTRALKRQTPITRAFRLSSYGKTFRPLLVKTQVTWLKTPAIVGIDFAIVSV